MKANRASKTAEVVAKATVFLAYSRHYGYLISEQAKNISLEFLHLMNEKRWTLMLSRVAFFRLCIRVVERLTIPGLLLHFALRKKTIEKVVVQSLASGIEQVVVLAAGFDTLCTRLHPLYPDVSFIELDHPNTQALKQRGLAQSKRQGKNFHLVPIDFCKTTLEEVLASAPCFDKNKKTLFIAEGITMYLTENEVNGLFQSVKNNLTTDGGFLFSYMCQFKKNKIAFKKSGIFTKIWLWFHREPFKWGLAPHTLAYFLDINGYQTAAHFDDEVMVRDNLKPSEVPKTVAKGEWLCLSTLAD